MRPPATGKPMLVFDGDCGFCRFWIVRWQRITGQRVDYAPYQEVASWFPDIPEERFADSVQLIEPNGRVTSGAEAVFRSLATRRLWAWPLWIYTRVPGAGGLSRICYRIVARHRPLFSALTRWGWGRDPAPSTWFLSRWLFLRALACVYLVAFVSLWLQIDGLVGPEGILPAESFLAAAREQLGPRAYWELPTLAWLHPGGRTPELLCLAGVALSVALLAGLAPLLVLPLLWAVYLSVTVTGQVFLGFQWDALLLETGFLAIILAPRQLRPGLALGSPPAASALLVLRWLLFKLMFMSGVVKLASGDPTWRNLTALSYHYETQPLPTWLGWYAHQLPLWVHKAACIAMFGVELALPFLIFLPRRPRLLAAAAFVGLQLVIGLTGNYGFFNLLSLVLLIPLLDDRHLARLVPGRLAWRLGSARSWTSLPRRIAAATLAIVVVALGVLLMVHRFGWPAPLPQPAVTVLRWNAPWRTVNGYGLFAVMTSERPEIQVEGSQDGGEWRAYSFRWKPGDPARRPPFVAPHMPRLDWQMWFAALGTYRTTPWFAGFQRQLLEGSPAVLALLESNPFPDAPPRYVRAVLYDYRFTTPQTAGEAWWTRTQRGLWAPAVSLRR